MVCNDAAEPVAISVATGNAASPRVRHTMCPATDRKKLHNDGQRRSAKLLVKGTLGPIRAALETG